MVRAQQLCSSSWSKLPSSVHVGIADTQHSPPPWHVCSLHGQEGPNLRILFALRVARVAHCALLTLTSSGNPRSSRRLRPAAQRPVKRQYAQILPQAQFRPFGFESGSPSLGVLIPFWRYLQVHPREAVPARCAAVSRGNDERLLGPGVDRPLRQGDAPQRLLKMPRAGDRSGMIAMTRRRQARSLVSRWRAAQHRMVSKPGWCAETACMASSRCTELLTGDSRAWS